MKLGRRFADHLEKLDREARDRLGRTLRMSVDKRAKDFPDLPVTLADPLLATARVKLGIPEAKIGFAALQQKLGDGEKLATLTPAELLAFHAAIDRAIADEATRLEEARAAEAKKAKAVEAKALGTPPENEGLDGYVGATKTWLAALEAEETVKARRALLLGEPAPAPNGQIEKARELAAAAEALRTALAATGEPHADAIARKTRALAKEVAEAEAAMATEGCRCGFGTPGTYYARRCVLALGENRLSWSAYEQRSCDGLCAAWKRDKDCTRLADSTARERRLAVLTAKRDAAKTAAATLRENASAFEAAKARVATARQALGQAPSSRKEPREPEAPPGPPPPKSSGTDVEEDCPKRVASLVFVVPAGSTVEVGGLRLGAPSGIARASTPPLPSCRSYYYTVRVWMPAYGGGMVLREITASVTPGYVSQFDF